MRVLTRKRAYRRATGQIEGFTGMFIIRGILQALAATLNLAHPWDNVAQRRAPATHTIAVNIMQLFIVVALIGGITRLMERLF